MPSFQHEALLQLFRNRPLLAAELLRDALQAPLPPCSEARVESAELNDVQPAEYRADLVVLLLHGRAVLGIVVEVQLSRDDAKIIRLVTLKFGPLPDAVQQGIALRLPVSSIEWPSACSLPARWMPC